VSAKRAFAVLGLLAAVAAVMIAIVHSDGRKGHRVTLVAASADYLSAGSQVRAAGVVVGQVVSAAPTRSGQARLVLEIDDPTAWPIPRATQVQFRWASTIAFTNRYVELDFPSSGARGGLVIPAGGTIPADHVTPTVELDQVFSTFDAGTRASLGRLFAEGGPALANAGPGLRAVLDKTPPALIQANRLLGELGADPEALRQLVASADTVVHAIEVSNPGVGQFVTGAAHTFAAVGSQASQLQALLTETPPTLDTARTTLAHAGRTLIAATRLLTGLEPGIEQVRAVAAPLNGTLESLVKIGPDAQRTLSALRAAVPYLNPLLTKATQLMPELGSVGRQAATELNCIRPYSPEIAGFATTWTALGAQNDGLDKYFRANASVYAPPVSATPLTSAQFLKLFPGKLTYAFPRPPGYNWGQPWFNGACGVGPDTLKPADDPMAVNR
jgi:phospholipid/cholesterol/gamma-HCH transport system substrate-binding protein